MFVHDTGLWPSSNIRGHARRIVSRQKSEHDGQIPEYTFDEKRLTWVCPKVSSIEFAVYVTDHSSPRGSDLIQIHAVTSTLK